MCFKKLTWHSSSLLHDYKQLWLSHAHAEMHSNMSFLQPANGSFVICVDNNCPWTNLCIYRQEYGFLCNFCCKSIKYSSNKMRAKLDAMCASCNWLYFKSESNIFIKQSVTLFQVWLNHILLLFTSLWWSQFLPAPGPLLILNFSPRRP